MIRKDNVKNKKEMGSLIFKPPISFFFVQNHEELEVVFVQKCEFGIVFEQYKEFAYKRVS